LTVLEGIVFMEYTRSRQAHCATAAAGDVPLLQITNPGIDPTLADFTVCYEKVRRSR
jgi:hypothetical protein